MGEESNHITESIHIKNMVSHCCKFLLREKLEQANIQVLEVTLGKARISYDKDSITHSDIENILTANGFGLLENKEDQLVSQIKLAVIELIHHLNNMNSVVRKSEYLVEKLGFSYPYLSKVFSENEGITLEKYIINQKIERTKHLLNDDEYSLSEIAFMMDYSSVQYLSNQFKKITGVTVSQYKSGSEIDLKSIDEL